MTIPTEQKQQILDNFYLLCQDFLPNFEVQKKLKIVFQSQEVEGKTFFNFPEQSFIIAF
jgi:hypothetical protein